MMSGLFQGLEIGKRALSASQLWLQTIGHNVANVNTPGYSRQRVRMITTHPDEHPVGPIGSGVKATSVYQVRDLFLSQQFRADNKALGEWTAREKTLAQIESVFNEPNDGSLSNLLDQFWNAWSDLSKPENVASTSARKNLIALTNVLTDG
ncbi:MAG: flagellar hook-associated protein FlgK, partial [Candidatus Zixiibacteriota bacterium]